MHIVGRVSRLNEERAKMTHKGELLYRLIHDAQRSLMNDYDVLSAAAPHLEPKERLFLERQRLYQDEYSKRSALHSWMLCNHGTWLYNPCRKCRRSQDDANKYAKMIASALARLVNV